MLWVIIACLTAAVLLALLRPLFLSRGSGAARDLSNAQVYRDQLSEIDSDQDRGLIEEAEAKAAKLEIQRRLLAMDGTHAARADRAQPKLERWLMVAVAVGLPLVALGLYFHYGSPGLPDEPLMARLRAPINTKNVPALIGRVEEQLRMHPDDGRGWNVIAPVYLSMRRYQDAANAYQKAIALLGPTAERLSGYGEASALANDGVINDDARKALREALKLDPSMIKPHILLALAAEQNENYAQALKDWKALLAHSKGNKKVEGLVKQKIAADEAKLSGKPVADAGKPAASGQQKGPSQAQVAEAENMSPAARKAMIETMVGRLAARLDQNGNDIDGWLKLVRAYVVLDRKDDAQKALAKAKTQFSGNASALNRLNALAAELGLQS